jgi:alkaline phosphatase D
MRRCWAIVLTLTFTLAGCDDGDDPPPAPPPPSATFTHGVAAGDVQATSAVLWTRAAGGDRLIAEVTSAGGTLLRLEAEADAARDFTVHLPVTGLTPDTAYEYRFRAGSAVSETGAFTTPPAPATPAPMRFVFAGDSDGTRDASGTPAHGEFDVLRAAASEDPAFFLYLGDTIYADRGAPATTLDAYRAKYRDNREYAALREILALTSVVTMWDDHEVTDNFAGRTVDPALLDAGRRAFREYWPTEHAGRTEVLYRSLRFGAGVELIVLDTRSFRDPPAADICDNDPLPAGARPDAPENLRGVREIAGLSPDLPSDCIDTLDDPGRSMLGGEQKQFLLDRLRDSDATWKIVATSVPMQALLFQPYDRWEGYTAERREVLQFIRDNGVRNVVFISTDLHANIFGPVRIDPFADPAPVAYEAIAGPIAAETLEQDIVNVLGESGGGLLGPFLTGIVGVECAQLDAFAYGVVEADAANLTVTAKDAAGATLCAKTLEAQ